MDEARSKPRNASKASLLAPAGINAEEVPSSASLKDFASSTRRFLSADEVNITLLKLLSEVADVLSRHQASLGRGRCLSRTAWSLSSALLIQLSISII